MVWPFALTKTSGVPLPKNKDLPGNHYPDIYDGKFPLKKLQNFILLCCPDPPVNSLFNEGNKFEYIKSSLSSL